MRTLLQSKFIIPLVSLAFMLIIQVNAGSVFAVYSQDCNPDSSGQYVTHTGQPCAQAKPPFVIPNFSDILTFAIRAIFIIGGLAALLFLLLGALAWITSGGEKEKVHEAQQKIQAAVLGVILIAVVLAIAVTIEQVIFGGKICLGLSCPITIPALIQ